MNISPTSIDRLRIATPCPTSWDRMTGDDRVRFCDLCQLNVYNIAELSRPEAEKLIASREGRMCVRLYRRADGTVLTNDCPVGLRALRLRVSKRVAAVFAAILSFTSIGSSQQPTDKAECIAQTRITRTNTPGALEPVVTGTAFDPNQVVIPNAKVILTNLVTLKIIETKSSEAGQFEFRPLEAGNYSLTIEAPPNFRKHIVRNIVVDKAKSINIDIILQPESVTVLVGVLADSGYPDLTSSSTTTIISGEMMRRLPIPY